MSPGFGYTIDLVAPGNKLDAFLRLENAKGQKLAEDDDGGGDLNSRIVFHPNRTEEYRLIVSTFTGPPLGTSSSPSNKRWPL